MVPGRHGCRKPGGLGRTLVPLNHLGGRIRTMCKTHRWAMGCLAGLALTTTALTGCQTNVAGMTLPSGHYLEHPPQFIADTPPFPLSRELASMQMQGAPASTTPT